MNSLIIEGNWNEIAGKLKQKFANLTEKDLIFQKDKEEELFRRLQNKLGKTKDELYKIISKL